MLRARGLRGMSHARFARVRRDREERRIAGGENLRKERNNKDKAKAGSVKDDRVNPTAG